MSDEPMGTGSEHSLVDSFGFAMKGVSAAARQRNFRIDLCFAVLALVLCAVLSVSLEGWLAVIICIGAVLSVEALNTAMEAVVDLASPELHPLAAKAKDCAAGASLILAVTSLVVACLVYIPAFLRMIG